MPTYAYACTACQHAMEVKQSFSDDALTTCPVCGGRLRKRFDNVGIVFKGSGFYRTDSRGSGGGDTSAPAKADASSGDGGGAKDTGASTEKKGSDAKSSDSKGSASKSSGSNGSGASSAPAPAKAAPTSS